MSLVNSATHFNRNFWDIFRSWKPLDEMLWLTTSDHKHQQCLIFVISLCACSAVLHSPWISLFLAKLFHHPQIFQSADFLIPFLGKQAFFRLKERKGEKCSLSFEYVWALWKNRSVCGDGVWNRGVLLWTEPQVHGLDFEINWGGVRLDGDVSNASWMF